MTRIIEDFTRNETMDWRMRASVTLVLMVGLVCFVALSGALAQGDGNNASDSNSDDRYAAVVTMTDSLKFVPESIPIEAGQTVLFKNEPSTLPHTVTAKPELAKEAENVHLPSGAEPLNSGKLQPGDTFTHGFHTPGRYRYFCIPHELDGMIGEVHVRPAPGQKVENSMTAGEDGQAATADSDEDATTDTRGDGEDVPFVLGAHRPPRPPGAEEATGLFKFAYWLGSFHPPATDLPIALMMAALLSEALRIVTRREAFTAVTRFCVWVGALSGLAAGMLGWCLAGFRLEDPVWLLDRHRWFGTGTAAWLPVVVVLMEISIRRERPLWRALFLASLLVAVVLIGVTGFFGGAMIYGIDHYNWPN